LIREELEGIYYIMLKDLKAYYFKPPNISWGILLPLAMAAAFTLRNPSELKELSHGLVVMAALFGTTSMEAIVITFERRVGAMERLILAPLSLGSIIAGKVLGGAIFGLMMGGVMTFVSLSFLGATIAHPFLFSASMLLSVFAFSALGALVAVSVKEVFEAQTLSNYLRFPMMFLCGIFFPVEEMPQPLQALAYLLPVTYSVDALRRTSTGLFSTVPFLIDLAALILFLVLFFVVATQLLRRSLR